MSEDRGDWNFTPDDAAEVRRRILDVWEQRIGVEKPWKGAETVNLHNFINKFRTSKQCCQPQYDVNTDTQTHGFDKFVADRLGMGMRRTVDKDGNLSSYVIEDPRQQASLDKGKKDGEMWKSYCSTLEARMAMLMFAEESLMPVYDKNEYGAEFRKLFADYFGYIGPWSPRETVGNKSINDRLSTNGFVQAAARYDPGRRAAARETAFVQRDEERRALHLRCGQWLADNDYVPNIMMGVTITRVFLLSLGYENFRRLISLEKSRPIRTERAIRSKAE